MRNGMGRAWRVVAVVVVVAAALRTAGSGGAQDGPEGSLLFVRDGDVWVWRGGSAAVLFEDGAASDPRWSPRGDGVLFVRAEDSYSDLVVRWLGDASESYLTVNDPGYDAGSEEYVLYSAWIEDPVWTPANIIAFVSDDAQPDRTMMLWTMAGPEGDPNVAAYAAPEESIESVSLSSDGAIAAYTVRTYEGGGTQVVLRDLNDGTVYPLIEEPGGAYDPVFSPDDSHIVASVRTAGVTDLWLVSRESGESRQLTNGAEAIAATWSPDGRWLAYLSPHEDGFTLWALPMDAAMMPGQARQLGDFPDLDATSGLSWTLLA